MPLASELFGLFLAYCPHTCIWLFDGCKKLTCAFIMMGWARALLLLAVANAGTSPEGKTWLEAKAKEDGVVTLESGLMYKVLRDGDGENHPKASTSCECHYEGKLIDGTVFDSSYERGSPTSFAPNQVINCVEIKCRGESLPRPNYDLHAIDATPARRRAPG
jgi:hypothetical protein